MRKLVLLSLLLLPVVCLAASGPQKVVLDNGLTLVVEEDHSAPVATVQFFVGTGSSLEGEYLGTGISHLIEHTLNDGTTTRTTEELTRIRSELGNTSNAYTSKSVVSYYVVTSGAMVRKAIDYVADYVFNPSFPEEAVQTQKGIIEREMARGEDDPGRQIYNLFSATMFRQSPDGTPVIGYLDQFRELEREDLVALHKRFYVPGNVVAVVVGDFPAAEVMAHLTAQLGKVPQRAFQPPVLVPEPPQVAPRRAVRETSGLSRSYLMLGYPTVSLFSDDMYPLDVLAYILANGDASRLVSRLRDERGLVDSISCYSSTPAYDAGFFAVSAVTAPDKVTETEQAIQAELAQVMRKPVTTAELARAKRQKEAELVFARVTTQGRATMYGNDLLTTGDLGFSEQYVARIRKVTAADIQRVARLYFRPERHNFALVKPSAPKPTAAQPAGASAAASATPVEETALPNGLRVLTQENHAVPVVNLFVAFRGGLLSETEQNAGITSLMTNLLVRGTKTRDRLQVARALEDVGGALSPYSGRNSFGLSAQVRSQDLPLALQVASDVLRNPAFPEDELQQLKQLQLAALASREDDVDTFAMDQMVRGLFTVHPYRFPVPGTRESVERLGRDDLVAYHQQYVRPENMVLAVFGDVDRQHVMRLVEKEFGEFHPAAAAAAPPRPQEPPLEASRQETLRRPQQQAILVYGFPGPKITDEDRYARDVMTAVFAGLGYPGGRLHESLRGKQLVYATWAFTVPGPETGYFVVYAGTAPDKAAVAQAEIEKIIRDLQNTPPSEQELALGKAVAVSSHAVQLESSADRAQASALNVLNGLGREEIFRYAEGVGKVTAEQVREQARRLLNLDRKAFVMTVPEG